MGTTEQCENNIHSDSLMLFSQPIRLTRPRRGPRALDATVGSVGRLGFLGISWQMALLRLLAADRDSDRPGHRHRDCELQVASESQSCAANRMPRPPGPVTVDDDTYVRLHGMRSA